MKKALWAVAVALLAWTPVSASATITAPLPDDIAIDADALPGGLEALTCLALNDYWEARGESLQGRLAVAHVVMNRVADARYPGEVCEVVLQHLVPEQPRACQFSWTCDGRPDTPENDVAWRRSVHLALAVLHSGNSIDDPTNGALWYHAASVRPAWIGQLVEATVIGAHIFYRDPPVPPVPLPRPDILVAAVEEETPRTLPAELVDGVVVAANMQRFSDGMSGGIEQVAVAY